MPLSFTENRKKTRQISIGRVKIGGFAPVAVQSMTSTHTQDVPKTVAQIKKLEEAGCEIIRVAVPDKEAALAISAIKKEIAIPLVADIHFDHRLAILSAQNGADALRINPGNIGGADKIKQVVECANDFGIPIRIGVNAGSLEQDILDRHHGVTAAAMVESALRHIDLLTSNEFYNIKISLKASDVPRTIEAYRLLSEKVDFPLHLGVTEAGTLFPGIVKSSLGVGMLLSEGIGDTLRISLTSDPVNEVRVGYEILKALGLRRHGPELISCPSCGRCDIDLFHIVEEIDPFLLTIKTPIKVAIMGCVVNGPGEAREADVGIAGGNGVGILFKKGAVVKKFPQEKLVEILKEEIRALEETPSS